MSWNLPKLPGFTFKNPDKDQFHLPHKLKYDKGYAIVQPSYLAPGREEMDSQGTQYLEVNNAKFDPQLIYGDRSNVSQPIPLPHYVKFDKKMLILKAYMKQADLVFDTSAIIRYVNIIYHLEDDTMSVGEPHIKNSGLYQGKIVKRGKILKDDKSGYWHWKDLNIGIDLKIYGMVFHTVSCDDYTKQFLESQGIEVCENEEAEEYEQSPQARRSEEINEPRRNLERYLIYDNKALRFDAVWNINDSQSDHTEMRHYKLSFFLYDNTVSIKECYGKKDGRDPFSMLLRRTRLPKDWKTHRVYSPLVTQESDDTDKNDDEYYNASDLVVGNTINVLGRPFVLLDCDYSTRNYYREILHITQPPRVVISSTPQIPRQLDIPPHIGIGDPEDTLMSCFSFHRKSPRKDVVQYNLNTNKHLRYLCEMISVHPENRNRKFVLLYSLADGTIRLDELSDQNSGIVGGRFFGPAKVQPPGGGPRDFYTPASFYIGAIIMVHQHKFSIIGADLFVYKYMKQFPEKFPMEVVQNMLDYQIRSGALHEQEATKTEEQRPQENLEYSEELHETREQDYHSQTELPPALQGLESAQTMPVNIEKEQWQVEGTSQPFVCVTGMKHLEDNTETEQILNYEMNALQDMGIDSQNDQNTAQEKRVTFANLPIID